MPNCTADSYESCPRCGSANLIRQTGDDEPTSHYGRLKCGNCNKHLQWLKDPSTSLQTQQRAGAINTILNVHSLKLSSWERKFLVSVRESRHLTEKQQDKLNSISMKCMRVRICLTEQLVMPEAETNIAKSKTSAH
jgi:ribosomal protein S27AE